MKHLTLIRHAKSSWKHSGLDDFDRPLNSRGKHDASMMGKKLAEKKVQPDLMISSPAKRALKTARMIAEEIGYPMQKIEQNIKLYEADRGVILDVIRSIDDTYSKAMMFGHNPWINDLSYELTNYDAGNFPTCGIFTIAFDTASWNEVAQGKGKFVSFEYPKKYYY